jgi:hypothetical protein
MFDITRIIVSLSHVNCLCCRDSSVSIGTRLLIGGPRNRSSIPGTGKRFLSSSQRSDQLWGSASFLYSEHPGLFSRGKAIGP